LALIDIICECLRLQNLTPRIVLIAQNFSFVYALASLKSLFLLLFAEKQGCAHIMKGAKQLLLVDGQKMCVSGE